MEVKLNRDLRLSLAMNVVGELSNRLPGGPHDGVFISQDGKYLKDKRGYYLVENEENSN